MKYCVSINRSTIIDTLRDLSSAAKKADMLEIRFDKMHKKDSYHTLLLASALKTDKPVIITCRNKRNGGFFNRSEKARLEFLKFAMLFGYDYIDIEDDLKKADIDWFLNHPLRKGIIISHHNFDKTPNNLKNIYSKIKKYNPDIIKICTFANKLEDNLKILSLQKYKSPNTKLITHCMGEKGELSRILGGLQGNFFTYSSLDQNFETAPGQFSISKMKSVYYLDRLKKNHKVYGLAGNPVKHSFGYIIHNYALNKLKINGVYVNFPVDDLRSFIKDFKGIFDGLSVTIPFKEKIIPLLDYIHPIAGKIMAVNTIVKKNNKLYGYNTDAIGIYNSLINKIKLKNQVIAILGNGGSARSAVSVIPKKDNKIFILGRDPLKAKKLADEFSVSYGSIKDLKDIKFSLLVNTTPVGMYPNINESLVEKKLIKNCTVFDIIYNPAETLLLKYAKANGCKTISGIDMFLYQAEAQFHLLTGKRFPYPKYKNKIISLIKNAH